MVYQHTFWVLSVFETSYSSNLTKSSLQSCGANSIRSYKRFCSKEETLILNILLCTSCNRIELHCINLPFLPTWSVTFKCLCHSNYWQQCFKCMKLFMWTEKNVMHFFYDNCRFDKRGLTVACKYYVIAIKYWDEFPKKTTKLVWDMNHKFYYFLIQQSLSGTVPSCYYSR